MFINLTNHPFERWEQSQKAAAMEYGEIREYAFPNVPPEYTTQEVRKLADAIATEIAALKPSAVLCQGEMTLTYELVRLFKQKDIKVFASCSERNTIERINESGHAVKVSEFCFVQFREY